MKIPHKMGLRIKKLKKIQGLLQEGMRPNIFLIGRALYLAVSEVIKMRTVPRRRVAAL